MEPTSSVIAARAVEPCGDYNSEIRRTWRCTRAGGDVGLEVNINRARRVNLNVRRKVVPMANTLEKPATWMVAELRRRIALPVVECQRMLSSATLADYRRIGGGRILAHGCMALSARSEFANICGTASHAGPRPFRVDPVEDNSEFASVLLRAQLEVDAELAGEDRLSMGFCHLFWRTKQRILREHYGLEWRTPAELNPEVLFD